MRDELLQEAKEICREVGFVSVSKLQHKMRIGYTRAGRLVDYMIQDGFCEKDADETGIRKLDSTTDLIKQIEMAIEIIRNNAGGRTKVSGSTKCTACPSGTLVFYVAYNGHISGKCDTGRCLDFTQ